MKKSVFRGNGRGAVCLAGALCVMSLTACQGTAQSSSEAPVQEVVEEAPAQTAEEVTEPEVVETVSEDTVSDDTVSENTVSDNTVSGDSVSSDMVYEVVLGPDGDNPRNQDGIGENEMLVVSFGTSYNDQRKDSIGAIEEALEQEFTDYSIRRAFTSQIVIDHIKERDGEVIDNVKEALDRAVKNGVKNLVVIPTHLMNGNEYTELEQQLAEYADSFENVTLGKQLLDTDDDFEYVMDAIVDDAMDYEDGETAICFMGHGTDAESNQVYTKLQKLLEEEGNEDYYIGTVEAKPDVNDILAAIKDKEYTRVVLKPLMVVGGDHANNDMAGDEPDSWKSIFTAAGYEVICETSGLGCNEDIRDIYIEHAQNAVDEAEEKIAKADVASPSEMAGIKDVEKPGATPVFPSDIKNGTYEIEVDSSSSMFNITGCTLTVGDNDMSARLQMGGTGYLYIFPGTGEEAVKAGEGEYIPFEEKDGVHFFTLPVEALDKGIAVSAYSRAKEKWYDRTLLFRSDSIPADALPSLSAVTAADLKLPDGRYTADVTLEGGSGKAGVKSPAVLDIKGGKITATIEFSSTHYDYVKKNGVRYDRTNKEGNSTFELPVEGFDRQLAIIADTTAMSKPHEIDYTIEFKSGTVKSAD